jgi:hypothetical protein
MPPQPTLTQPMVTQPTTIKFVFIIVELKHQKSSTRKKQKLTNKMLISFSILFS